MKDETNLVEFGNSIHFTDPICARRKISSWRMVTICIFYVFVTVSSSISSVSAASIGLDAVHGSDADVILATGSEYDSLRSIITGHGHTIVPLNSFGAANLAGLDAAFLLTPYTQNSANYSLADIEAIHSFANQRAVFVSDSGLWSDADGGSQRPITFGGNEQLLENVLAFVGLGGGAVFLGDDGTGFDIANMNTLVAPYGISYATFPTDGNGRTVSGLLSNALTAGVTEIGIDFQVPLTIGAPSLDLTVGGGQDNVLAVFDASNPIPAPSTMLLFGSGLAGLGLADWRYRKSKNPYDN